MYSLYYGYGLKEGRPPHGGRGLKCWCDMISKNGASSSSTRRTWIEINHMATVDKMVSSSSTRRTWIEIGSDAAAVVRSVVVLHTEDVD